MALGENQKPQKNPDVFWRESILGIYIYESVFLVLPAFILFEYDHESYKLETYGPLFLVPGSYFNTVENGAGLSLTLFWACT